MRAKSINEMDFKRGEEPYKALSLGILGEMEFTQVGTDINDWKWHMGPIYGSVEPFGNRMVISLILRLDVNIFDQTNAFNKVLGALGIKDFKVPNKNYTLHLDDMMIMMVWELNRTQFEKLGLPWNGTEEVPEEKIKMMFSN